jgi:intron-binding protein aquarius
MLKRDEKDSEEKKKQNEFSRTFFQRLISNFTQIISNQDYLQPELPKEFLLYCERFIELMIDLQALLPTRRYLNVVIDDQHLIVKCQMCPLLEHGDGHLFSQLLDRLKFYAHFEICNETGDPMSEMEVMDVHYKKITSLQVLDSTHKYNYHDLLQTCMRVDVCN